MEELNLESIIEAFKSINTKDLQPYKDLGNGLYELPGNIITNKKGLKEYLNELRKEVCNMELKDYTTEELKAELKKRAELARIQKAEEMKAALRCRNCKHCYPDPIWGKAHQCIARTWGKKYPRHYRVTLSTKACDKFERKED